MSLLLSAMSRSCPSPLLLLTLLSLPLSVGLLGCDGGVVYPDPGTFATKYVKGICSDLPSAKELELSSPSEALRAHSATSVEAWRGKQPQSIAVIRQVARGSGGSEDLQRHARKVMVGSGGYGDVVYFNVELEAKFTDGTTATGTVSLAPQKDREWRVVPAAMKSDAMKSDAMQPNAIKKPAAK